MKKALTLITLTSILAVSLIYISIDNARDKEIHISFKTYAELSQYFDKIGYDNLDKIPKVYVEHLPRDLSKVPTNERKKLFIKILLPLLIKVNAEIESQRKDILKAIARKDKNTISKYMKLYKSKDINDLLLKVDKIPLDLGVAQAAIESAWGTSRFAIDANNLFGEWTFEKGKGLVPKERPKGKTYEVKYFPTLLDSVKSYAMNLNTKDVYDKLRKIRAGIKDGNVEDGLLSYSTQGKKYIDTIKRVMKTNNLKSLVESLKD